MPVLDRWLLITAILMTTAVVIETLATVLEDTRDPVTIERVETLNSPVAPGTALVVRIWREKVRDDCLVQSARSAIDEDGRSFPVGTVTVKGGPVGTEYVDVLYPLPGDLPVGTYVLRVQLTYLCPDGPHLVAQPDARFRVEGE